MIRPASALILIGLVPVAHVLWDPAGATAIRATFFGGPCVLAGVTLYLVVRFAGRGSSE